VPEAWRLLALSPPRAYGAPVVRGRIRGRPEDFAVDEELGFAASGDGPHVMLRIRKRSANTEWVARELARDAHCKPMDVGFAGLKDRHAVTTQWFTVPRGARDPQSWLRLEGDGFVVLEAYAHHRKLPRGALKANRFTLRIGELEGDLQDLARRFEQLARGGVPDYFGPQRFGRELQNLSGLPQIRRGAGQGFVISAARSLIFNAILARRVHECTWNLLMPGDVANLDGTQSIFDVREVDAALAARCTALDLHPTAALWGLGATRVAGVIEALEKSIAAQFSEVCNALGLADVRAARRSLRVAVRDLTHAIEGNTLNVSFRLDAGSFATTVLRELVDARGLSAAR